MKNWMSNARVPLGCALAAIAVALVMPATGVAAERVVLGEEFTATW